MNPNVIGSVILGAMVGGVLWLLFFDKTQDHKIECERLKGRWVQFGSSSYECMKRDLFIEVGK